MWKLHQPGRLIRPHTTGRPDPSSPRWRAGLVGLLILLAACAGCPFSPSEPTDSDVPFFDAPENSTFDKATALPLAPDDALEFEGQIELRSDLDLFELGQLSPGDRLSVDVQPTDANLDLVAAVFDSREYLHAYNDDRTPDSSDLNPLLDFVIRGEAGTYFLGIAPYAESRATGTYRVTVRITRGVGVPDPTPQVVFLDWDGGQNIIVPNVGTFDLPPFDAGDLGPFGDRTEDLKDRVQEIVAERYAEFNLILLNSDDNAVPAVPHTTVYFGGEHPQAFAIAEQIDTMNEDASDDTIIFTQSYRNAFLRTPTFEQIAQALGNTVAHEIGHLFGLVHTADCDSLMDATCSNSRLLSPQEFTTAVLDPATFPIGSQAAEEILGWLLGFMGLAP